MFDGIDDGVTDGVRIEVLRIIKLILKHEGTNTLDLATQRGKSKSTVERYFRTAKEVGIVEFRGAPKTCGYYLSSKFKTIINYDS